MTIAPDQQLLLPRNLTFEPDDWQIIARYWYPVARVQDVTEQPSEMTLLDVPLVIYRHDGEVVVAEGTCPHRGMLLSRGKNPGDGLGIQCPYHGIRFGAGGACTRIPAHPDSGIPARMDLRAFGVVEAYGLIWTSLASRPGDVGDIPPCPHWDDEGFQQINCPTFDLDTFAGRQVEGFLDVGHFAFVHEATFADPENTVVPDYTPVPTEDGFEVDYYSTVANYLPGAEKSAPDDYLWLRRYRLHLPFVASLVIPMPDGGRIAFLNAATPMSARRTRLFDARVRDVQLDQPLEEVYEFNRIVFEEDASVTRWQKPENLPLDPKLEVHIAADRSSIAYRRALRGLGLGAFFTA